MRVPEDRNHCLFGGAVLRSRQYLLFCVVCIPAISASFSANVHLTLEVRSAVASVVQDRTPLCGLTHRQRSEQR